MSAEAVQAAPAPAEAAPADVAPQAEAPPAEGATTEADGGESSLDVLDDAVEGEETAEAAPEEPKRKRKTAAERAHDRRQRRERLKREQADAQLQRDHEKLQRELAEVRREREEFQARLRADHTGTLQELGMSREDILAQQADEMNMSPVIRREMMDLKRQIAEQDKRFNEYRSAREQADAQAKFQAGVSQDVEWISSRGGDRDGYPHLSRLDARKRAEFAERAVLEAVKSGDKDATRKTILDDLEDEIAEWAATFAPEPTQAAAAPAPAPSEPAKRTRTRAASARGAAAPSAAKPASDHERRQSTLQLARQLRKEREEAKAERRAAHRKR